MKSKDLFKFLSDSSPGTLLFGGTRMALLDIEAGFWSIRRQMDALIGAKLTGSVLQQAGTNGGASFAASFGKAKNPAEQGQFFESCLQAYQAAGFGRFEIVQSRWPIGQALIRAVDSFEAWMMQRHGQQVDGPVCAYTAGVLVGFVNVVSDRQDVVCIERKCQALGDDCCEFELLPAAESDEQSVVAFTPDPGLGRQLNLLEMLFDRMPMGIALLDRKYCVQRFNPTWMEYSERYAPPSGAPLVPGIYYFDHLPGTESVVMPLFERVLAGETVQQNSVRLEAEGIVSYWDIVLAPLVEEDDVAGILTVSVDATERVMLQQNLEQRVDERTRELFTLLQVSQNVSSTLELDVLLGMVLDQLKQVLDYNGASLMSMDRNVLRILAYRGPIGQDDILRLEIPFDSSTMNYDVIRSGEPIIIPDVYADTPAARSFRQTAGDELDTLFGYIRCWMGIPLKVKGEVIGMLSLDHSQPNFYTAASASLALAFANQAAIAIENARLFEKTEQAAAAQERNRLARDLHDAVSQTLFSASLIADVLPKLWDRNPEAGKQKLDELRLLTRGALSEMRTLLLELRPATLVDMDLGDLLRHLTNAFTGRTRVPVELKIDGQIDPLPQIKEVFYRVAQEALNNITKHADASQVSVNLQCGEGHVQLEIRDDGRGFDLQAISPENLGLSIMRERAETVGAHLEIHSKIRSGTRIELLWKDKQE
jgi:two-component system nitrate/nitrite sensor histidine kinase NarX